MATVPIEIVLQDAETPVDPTPTPESGEETNIIVPSTGTISNDGSSNGGIGSAISIILPIVITVLALGAMVALLVRRQQKRKNNINANMSKKEKFFTATSGTIAILAATVLVGNLVIPATKAATDDANDNEGTYLETEDKITITATIDKDSEEDTYIVSTKDILYATTDASGYTVTMSMIEGALTSNLYLDGDEASEYYIAPVEVNEANVEEGAELTTNTWGYTLAEEAEEYLPVPLADTPATIKEGEEAVEHEEIDVYYTVKVDKELPLGTYTGTIEYNIEGNYGFPKSLTTMQGMTHEICESVPTPNAFKADGVTIEDNVPTATLTDVRDNKTYTIAKLADGNCWMTQNLDLQREDLADGIVLNNVNTDNPIAGFELPDSGGGDWGSSWSEANVNSLHVYDALNNTQEYYYCEDYDPYGGCILYSDKKVPRDFLGNYYNWYTATAGTGIYRMSDGEIANGSICPANWRIPSDSNLGDATPYSNLLYTYGLVASAVKPDNPLQGDYEKMFMPPFSFIRAGFYSNGLHEVGEGDYFWASMSNDYSYAYEWTLNGTNVSPWSYRSKTNGDTIRCIAR